jgi:hypothetical protein
MATKTMNLGHRSWALAASVALAGCSDFGSDGEVYQRLERLRVLAIRSDPADLSLAETATLSANVYEPEGRELSYEWSWCPSRGDGTNGFGCNVSEYDLARAWMAAGLDGSPPSYDLGTNREAVLTHVLTPSLVAALCGAPGVDERIDVACFQGLEASVELTVRSSEEKLTAIKSVPLLMGEIPAAARNTNPASGFDLTVRDNEGNDVVETGDALQAGHLYTVVADVHEATAESFTPASLPGEQPPAARRETLVMSWFVTVGDLAAPEGDSEDFGGDFARTTFVGGSNEFGELLKNGWKIPLTAGSSAALHLVLRDERGGVGWAARRFDVVGGEP